MLLKRRFLANMVFAILVVWSTVIDSVSLRGETREPSDEYQDGDLKEVLNHTKGTWRQGAGGLPGLSSLIPGLPLPSINDYLPIPLPSLSPALACNNYYALCFSIFYGARKCCVGLICPPFGVFCEPNEKREDKAEDYQKFPHEDHDLDFESLKLKIIIQNSSRNLPAKYNYSSLLDSVTHPYLDS